MPVNISLLSIKGMNWSHDPGLISSKSYFYLANFGQTRNWAP